MYKNTALDDRALLVLAKKFVRHLDPEPCITIRPADKNGKRVPN